MFIRDNYTIYSMLRIPKSNLFSLSLSLSHSLLLSLSSPLLSSPLQSRMLVLEHGLLRIIVSTLLDILTPCKDPITGILKLRSSNYKHSRVFYIMYDLRYVCHVTELGLLNRVL